jgi:putative two-component system response regulator
MTSHSDRAAGADAPARQTILVVDDTPDSLALLAELLGGEYRVKVANTGTKALRIAAAGAIDLILLDVMMPDLDGYAVCARLKQDAATRDIPVIFLSAKNDVRSEKTGLDLGAVDYIAKPVSQPIMLARVRTHLRLKAAQDFLRDKNDYLEAEIASRTRDVSALQDVTILALASLAETRDLETGNHIRRTQLYLTALARALRHHPRFAEQLSDGAIALMAKSAPLHDIGKVGIPDRILLKPGPLTAEEFAIMKTHTTLGYEALDHAERALGTKVAFLTVAKEIAYCHQEKWDGSGYPRGLAGETIPLSARLMAVADVYDALISRCIYKDALPHATAAATILASRGSHFDPDIVDAFERIADDFDAIAREFADPAE